MKKLITIAIALFFIVFKTSAQLTISPVQTAEYCPNVEYTFTISSLPADRQSNTSIIVMLGPTDSPQIISTTANTTLPFTIKLKFQDKNIKQSIIIKYQKPQTPVAQAPGLEQIDFTRIKSLASTSNCYNSYINLGFSGALTYPPCKITTQNISFNNIQYTTTFGFPDVCFGNISTYEYLIPSGWKLGNTVSSGSTWLPGGNNVNITSDLETGGNIRIRPTNASCGSGLVVNNAYTVNIPISRPAPPVPIITGPITFCTAGTYTITNLPLGATVVWSVTGSSFVTSGPVNTSSVNLVKTVDGSGVLTATVTPTCGAAWVINKSLTVGYQYINASVSGATTVYSNAGYYYNLSTVPYNFPISNFRWLVPAGWSIVNGQGTPNISVWTGTSGGTVECEFLDVCGIRTSRYMTAVIGSGGPLPQRINPTSNSLEDKISVYPNPANNEFVVSYVDNINGIQDALQHVGEKSEIKIEIYNNNAKKVIVIKDNLRLKDVVVNTQNLLNGTYFLHITDGKETIKKQIIIQH